MRGSAAPRAGSPPAGIDASHGAGASPTRRRRIDSGVCVSGRPRGVRARGADLMPPGPATSKRAVPATARTSIARQARSPGPRRTLILLVKVPRPGRVKTRLARDIGTVAACWWFRHQTARMIRNLGRDRRWHTLLAVAPDTALAALDPVWPPGLARIAQGAGDMGARMRRALDRAPSGPAVLIGADIPAVRPAHIARAFSALGRGEAVFGPAGDGGYWLIGLKRGGLAAPAGLLQGVRWSHPQTLADSLATLGPLRPVLIDRLADVDTAADLARSADQRS